VLNINNLIKSNEIQVFNDNGCNYVCVNGHALYRQNLWPNTACVTVPPDAIKGLLSERDFMEAILFPYKLSINAQSITIYVGESENGVVFVKVFDGRYTKPFLKHKNIYFGLSKHNPVYALDGTLKYSETMPGIDAIVMPWNTNWNNPLYGFLRRSAESWYKDGENGLEGVFTTLPEGIELGKMS